MGIFEGYLICTDLDDTLLTTDKKVSDENIAAINRFMAGGGKFTFATGRVPYGVRHIFNYIKPNVPMVCFNGAAIYDIESKKYLWKSELAPGAGRVIDYIEKEKNFEFTGVEVLTLDRFYIHKTNNRVLEHMAIEKITGKNCCWQEVPEPWMKVIFMQEANEVDMIRQAIAETDFSREYNFVQSSPYYYEVLPKNATKGDAALKLCDILGVDQKKAIGIGDNENDITLVEKLGIGAVVSNASDNIKKYADIIAPHHNKNALAWIIDQIEKKRI